MNQKNSSEKRYCVFCNSNKFTEFFSDDDRFFKCAGCHVVLLDEKLWATNMMPDYYANANNYIHANQDPSYHFLGKKRARDLIEKIKKYSLKKEETKWLDVGANYGILVEELIKNGFNASGIELNKNLVSLAHERGLPIECADVISLREQETKYNVISAIDVLEHLPRPIDFLVDARKLLVSNGLLILEVPNIESYLARKHKAQWKYVDHEHLHYFSVAAITKLLKNHGFKVERIYTTNPFLCSFSITKLIHYFIPRKLSGDRLSRPLKAQHSVLSENNKQHTFGLLRKLIKSILIYGIKFLKREDFILIIAKKYD